MTTPILLQHIAFDKTLETTFPFTSVGGNQMIKNRLQVVNNSTLTVAYDSTQTISTLAHNVLANILINGRFYSAKIKMCGVSNVERG